MRPTFFFIFCCHFSFAQTSTFDTGNEGWSADGDPTSQTPAWFANNGNPGGHIRVTDASIGGTWYFIAPNQYHGNKCDAYGKWLRYDQFTSDTSNQQQFGGDPDVLLFGGGLTLIFDNANNPGLAWTHYDILLREDAGWRLNTLNGPVPTEAQFRAALADVAGIKIRGEYRAQADIGGLDNFVLESNFGFDLDGDDSSGAFDGDFLADTTCVPFSAIADLDAVLFSEIKIDSVVVCILYAAAGEVLELGAIPPPLSVQMPTPQKVVLENNGNAAPGDFLLALQTMRYRDLSPNPVRGERLIEFRVYTECGEMAIRYAYLPIYPPPDAGEDGHTTVCADGSPFDLFELLGGTPETGGYWPPSLSGSLFDPAKNAPGQYAYIIPQVGECAGDTAFVQIEVEQSFQLGSDTTVCHEDIVVLNTPPNLLSWEWSDGSNRSELLVASPGVYALTGQTTHCTFSDSVRVHFYTCEPCPFYAPNVFSPNDDGVNDRWHVFLPCLWQQFRLEIYDRWGNLVFAADDPDTEWDGSFRDREPQPGVYVWILEWTGELFGEPKIYRAEGDVTVLR